MAISHNIESYIDVYCDLFKKAIRNGENVPDQLPVIAGRFAKCCGASPARVRSMEHLLFQLPPVIARKRVYDYFGGVVTPKALANADYKGVGPRVKWEVGRNVCYPTPYLLEWMEEFGHDA